MGDKNDLNFTIVMQVLTENFLQQMKAVIDTLRKEMATDLVANVQWKQTGNERMLQSVHAFADGLQDASTAIDTTSDLLLKLSKSPAARGLGDEMKARLVSAAEEGSKALTKEMARARKQINQDAKGKGKQKLIDTTEMVKARDVLQAATSDAHELKVMLDAGRLTTKEYANAMHDLRRDILAVKETDLYKALSTDSLAAKTNVKKLEEAYVRLGLKLTDQEALNERRSKKRNFEQEKTDLKLVVGLLREGIEAKKQMMQVQKGRVKVGIRKELETLGPIKMEFNILDSIKSQLDSLSGYELNLALNKEFLLKGIATSGAASAALAGALRAPPTGTGQAVAVRGRAGARTVFQDKRDARARTALTSPKAALGYMPPQLVRMVEQMKVAVADKDLATAAPLLEKFQKSFSASLKKAQAAGKDERVQMLKALKGSFERAIFSKIDQMALGRGLAKPPRAPLPIVSDRRAAQLLYRGGRDKAAGRAFGDPIGSAKGIDKQLGSLLAHIKAATATANPKAGMPFLDAFNQRFNEIIKAARGDNKRIDTLSAMKGQFQKSVISEFESRVGQQRRGDTRDRINVQSQEQISDLTAAWKTTSAVFRAQRTIQRPVQDRTFDELRKDIKALDQTFRKLNRLEAERASTTSVDEAKGITKQIGTLHRQIAAQEDRLAYDALDSRALTKVPITRVGLRQGKDGTERKFAELARKGGQVMMETMTKPEAFIRMKTFFANSLGEALVQATRRAGKLRTKALGRGDAAGASELAEFSQEDMMKAIFSPEKSKHAAMVAASMKAIGMSSKDFATNNVKAYASFQKLSKEMHASTRTAELLDKLEKRRAERTRKLAGYYRAIRGLSYTIGGFAIGLTAGQKIRESFGAGIQLEQEMAGIRGVLPSRSKRDTEVLKGGIISAASTYGADLIETAKAARILAQTGMGATAVMRELNISMLAMRGVGVTVQQMQELQIAIRAVASEADRLDATASVLDKIARVESSFAITATDIADALKLASPIMNQFAGDLVGLNDVFDLTIGLSTTMVEQLRITGNQAGNALKFILARLARPEVLTKLQEQFGVRLAADPAGKTLLPLGDMLKELTGTFKRLSQAQAQQFAVLLAGGRRVTTALTFLENYDRVLEIANVSSRAFGDAQERSAIQLDTLASSMERLGTNFKVFMEQLNDTSGVSGGLQNVVDVLNNLLSISSGGGGGAFAGLGAMLLGGTAVSTLARGVYGEARDINEARVARRMKFKDIGGVPTSAAVLRNARFEQDMQRMGQTRTIGGKAPGMAARFGAGAVGIVTNPTFVVMAVLVGLFLAGGMLRKFAKAGEDVIDSFKVSSKSLTELGYFNSQQFRNLSRMAKAYGFDSPGHAMAATSKILLQGPETRARIREAVGKEGPGTFVQLAALMEGKTPKELRTMFPNLRGKLVEAFLADLPEGERRFANIETIAKRIAVVTKLIGESVLVATARMDDLMMNMEENVKGMQAHISSTLFDRFMFDPNNKPTWLEETMRGFTAAFTGRATFNQSLRTDATPIQTVGGVPRMEGGGEVIRGRVVQGLFEALGPLGTILEGVKGQFIVDQLAGTITEAENQFERLGPAIMHVLEAMDTVRLNTLDHAVAQAATFARMREVTRDGEKVMEKYNIVASTVGEAFDLAAQDRARDLIIGQDVLGFAGLGITARDVDVKDETEAGFALTFLGRMEKNFKIASANMRMEIIAAYPDIEERRKALVVFDASSMIAHQVAVVDATKALGGFRDKLVEFFIRAARDLQKIEVDQAVSQRFGQDFDVAGARFSTGRKILVDFLNLRSDLEAEIARDAAKLSKINMVAKLNESVFSTTFVTEAGEEIEASSIGQQGVRLEEKIEAYKRQIYQFFDVGAPLSEFLPKPEADMFLATFEKLREQMDTPGFEKDALDAFRQLMEEITASAREEMLLRKQNLAVMTHGTVLQRAQLDVMRMAADLELTRTAAAEMRLKADTESFYIQQQRREFELSQDGGLSSEDLQTLQDESVAFFEAQVVAFAKMRQEGINAYTQQVRANVRSSLSGVQEMMSNMDIWASLTDGTEGAFRQAFSTLLDPIAKTFSSRLAENLTENLAQELFKNTALMDLFGAPEVRMREEMIVGGDYAADRMLESMILGAEVIAGRMTPQAALSVGRGLGALITSGRTGLPTVVPQLAKQIEAAGGFKAFFEENKEALTYTAGAIGGSLLGGFVAKKTGKESNFASTGATLGTMAGMFLPGGPAVWGMIGGFMGGLVGAEKENESDRQIQALQAIERAQQETISTIESQTDSLLNPQNRFINLPTGFSVPAYDPSGTATGSGDVYRFDFSGMQVGAGADTAQLQRTIQDAVVLGISSGRRSSSRSARNF